MVRSPVEPTLAHLDTQIATRALPSFLTAHVIVVLVGRDVDVHDGELVLYRPVDVLDHLVNLGRVSYRPEMIGMGGCVP